MQTSSSTAGGWLVGAQAAGGKTALVYAPNAGGQLRLAAFEYIVFQDAWDATHSDPPQLFGQTFNLTPAGNRFGIPAFYSLHAWVWEPNSDGMLQPWNPRVHC